MSKAKLVQARRSSAEALRLADQLLAIAREDLRAARLLEQNSLVPQAVFSLQQAVEKAGKAYGLALGIAEPKELKHDWSHNTLRFSELMVDYRAQQTAPKSTGLAVTGAPAMVVTADRSKALMDKFEDPSALREPFLGTMITWCQACIADHRAWVTDPVRRKRQEEDLIASFVEGRADEAEIRKASAFAVYTARMLAEQAVLMSGHTVLGMATLPHAVRARYPNPSAAPEELYTAANPVVRRFDELCAICEPYLEAVAAVVAASEAFGRAWTSVEETT